MVILMPVNSKEKGKRFELEVTNALKAEGYNAHRSAQYAGNTGEAADVVGLPGIHIEAKRQEQLRLYEWMAQAVRDAKAAGRGDLPAVFFRKSNEAMMVAMRFEDWIKIYKEYEAQEAMNEDQ